MAHVLAQIIEAVMRFVPDIIGFLRALLPGAIARYIGDNGYVAAIGLLILCVALYLAVRLWKWLNTNEPKHPDQEPR